MADAWKDAASAAMDRYACGEDAAFSSVYDLLAPRLSAFLLRRTGDRARAEDLVQQTFLQMHCARRHFAPGTAVAPWAFAIARRLLIDGARRERPAIRSWRRRRRPRRRETVFPTAAGRARGEKAYRSSHERRARERLGGRPRRVRARQVRRALDGRSRRSPRHQRQRGQAARLSRLPDASARRWATKSVKELEGAWSESGPQRATPRIGAVDALADAWFVARRCLVDPPELVPGRGGALLRVRRAPPRPGPSHVVLHRVAGRLDGRRGSLDVGVAVARRVGRRSGSGA